MREFGQCETVLRAEIVGENDCLVAGNARGKSSEVVLLSDV